MLQPGEFETDVRSGKLDALADKARAVGVESMDGIVWF